MYGNMAGSYGLEQLGSVMRKDADLTYKALPGALKNVYVPSKEMAINAKSKNMDTAKEFFEFALSTDGQKIIDNYSGFRVNKDSFEIRERNDLCNITEASVSDRSAERDFR